MRIAKSVLGVGISLMFVVFCAWALGMLHPKSVAAQSSKDNKVILLDQGWTPRKFGRATTTYHRAQL